MTLLMRSDAFRDLVSLREAMNQLFEDSIVRPRGAALAPRGTGTLAIDMYETDEAVVVRSAIPGVDPADIEISMHGDTLTIKGETKTEEEVEEVTLPGLEVQVQSTIDRPGRYSDHIPFSEAGIPAARLIEAIETPTQQHSALDLPPHISPDYLRRATQLALATAINLADGPAQPSTPVIVPGPEKRLEWEPVAGAAGYIVGLRGAEDEGYEALVRTEEPHLSLALIENATTLRAVGVAVVGEDGLVGRFSAELLLDP